VLFSFMVGCVYIDAWSKAKSRARVGCIERERMETSRLPLSVDWACKVRLPTPSGSSTQKQLPVNSVKYPIDHCAKKNGTLLELWRMSVS
jgi:hypothetical protein